jgi:hypothetical protein
MGAFFAPRRKKPGYPLVSFLPAAKKDTASIPCANKSSRRLLINKCGIAEAPMNAPHVELMRFGFSRTSARAGQTASRLGLSEFSLRENSGNCGGASRTMNFFAFARRCG